MKNLLLILISTFFCAGCLTVEKKEYNISIKPDGSGSAKITFMGISSADEDSLDRSLKDYGELVDDYYHGNKLESEHPEWTNVKKNLKKVADKLYGELTFDFANAEAVGLFRYKNKGAWMYYVGNFGIFNQEKLDTNFIATNKNITYGGEKMPILFWDENTTEIKFRTISAESDRSIRSLLPKFEKIGIKRK